MYKQPSILRVLAFILVAGSSTPLFAPQYFEKSGPNEYIIVNKAAPRKKLSFHSTNVGLDQSFYSDEEEIACRLDDYFEERKKVEHCSHYDPSTRSLTLYSSDVLSNKRLTAFLSFLLNQYFMQPDYPPVKRLIVKKSNFKLSNNVDQIDNLARFIFYLHTEKGLETCDLNGNHSDQIEQIVQALCKVTIKLHQERSRALITLLNNATNPPPVSENSTSANPIQGDTLRTQGPMEKIIADGNKKKELNDLLTLEDLNKVRKSQNRPPLATLRSFPDLARIIKDLNNGRKRRAQKTPKA